MKINKRSRAYQKLKQLFLSDGIEIPSNEPENLYLWKTVNDGRARCSHFGIDFCKRSDNVNHEIKCSPSTSAQRTVHWFIYGRKFNPMIKHVNCKCSSTNEFGTDDTPKKPIVFSEEDFKREYECSFEPDERAIALQDRLVEYYESDELPVNINDRRIHLKAFKKWCDDRGYSQGEINNAKINVNQVKTGK